MATSATIPGPTSHRLVDLDAGTTLPRAVSIAVALLAVAALAVALLASQPGDAQSTPAPLPKVAPQAITMPAWSVGRADLPRGSAPAWPIGPSALIDASAFNASVDIGQ